MKICLEGSYIECHPSAINSETYETFNNVSCSLKRVVEYTSKLTRLK